MKEPITLETAPSLMTIRELAQVLRIGINGAYKLLADGEIPYKKIGRQYRIYKEDVIDYLRQDVERKSSPEKPEKRAIPLENVTALIPS